MPAFFSASNGLAWDEIASGSSPLAQALKSWFALILEGRQGKGILMPAMDPEGQLTWYGCASTPQDSAALAEQILSFVGPGAIEFDPTVHFEPRAAHEQILVDTFGPWIFRFWQRADANLNIVQKSLDLLADLLGRRPGRSFVAVRPFGKVRSDFEQALLTSDEVRARRFMEEMRCTGRLNTTNERFLEVRLRAALGQPSALVHDVSLMSLLAESPLPTPVLRDVVESLYAVYLAPLPVHAPPSDWVEAYRGHLHRHERLLRFRRGLRSSVALRVFLLRECANDADRFDQSVAQPLYDSLRGQPDDREWAEALWQWATGRKPAAIAAPPSLPPAAAVVPEIAATAESPEAELLRLTGLAPSAEVMVGLLRCGFEIGTIEAASLAIGALRTYPAELVSGMTAAHQRIFSVLKHLVPDSASLPVNWTRWATWLLGSEAPEEERAAALAQQGAEEWDHAAWLASDAQVTVFVDQLQKEPARFRPHLLTIYNSVCDLQGQPTALSRLVLQLLTLVALDSPEVSQLPAIAEWVSVLVRLGAGRASCDEAAEAVHAVWSEVNSMAALDWVCDVIETLATAPATPNGPLQKLYFATLGFATGHKHRLSAVQDRVLELLSKDFGFDWVPLVPLAAVTSVSGQAPRSFAGLSVGVYTLQVSIVPRLRSAITAMLPGVVINFNHDHVATEALEHMAKQCSVMVLAWRRAKHQATYCIQAQRPAGKPLLLPSGTGSASILRSLSEHFSIGPSHE
ncbi:protein DpdD [Variovorax sp. J22R133]|uniref:protein DpdD n=1 Tax=Variovorax brevis TaxID=3053503 RepID=UPI002577ABD0|nr:protein DpdD [Variovorax sp. J22R133]MDM0115658.1 protein DpdD [Variovorax sp. J22R133]